MTGADGASGGYIRDAEVMVLKRALVIGASSGMGAELVRRLAA
ncbi:MAG: NADP-dependent 3-hydroxy acid dehydrogenase YdfG, partial [Myxococcota bacterium]